MARMQTNSAGYFPLDVNYFTDRKIRRLKKECSHVGILVHLNLLCCVYSDKNGYYTSVDENLIFDISERFDISEDEVRHIMNVIFDIGLFNKKIHNSSGIITSQSVQLRFQEIVKKKACKTPVRVDIKYWLLDEFETKQYIIVTDYSDFSVKNGDSSEKNAINKIKENEIKINEIKINEIKEYNDDKTYLLNYPKKRRKIIGINNYIDTNKPDYSDFNKKIIEEMLESE